jgi:O-methyltransferase involved in polyketide biosynthesis
MLFLWQSVSLFLEAESVRETLEEMADLFVDGSFVAQDLYSKAFISGENSKTAKRTSRMVAKKGEPWKF